ncbi:MAG: hypothetical protein EOP04_14905 [Proteobacteria bacterium]|nr:MAG: hypothetical protein EOP04_14905 [Pseudomonadota bacterium]
MNFYTMLWPNEYCRYVEKNGGVGKPLRFVWGGHNRQSDFGFFGVKPGDVIIPVRVQDGRLFVIGNLTVRECIQPEEYVAANPTHERFIQNPCANQVLVSEEGAPIRFDIVAPTATLQILRFKSNSSKNERAVQLIEDGKLKNTVGFQGIYRLTEDSAVALLALLDT